MILNVNLGDFGGPLRNGDLLAVCNAVEFLRQKDSEHIMFHMKHASISQEEYVRKMYEFLLNNTDFFSTEPGTEDLKWKRINLWDFRAISGDLATIKNKEKTQKKIVVCPLFDAPYNTYRNWPQNFFHTLIEEYDKNKYSDYEKIICINKPLDYQFRGWRYSTDFLENLYHIQTAEYFIGAETGTSIFASLLDPAPPNLIYYYSGRGLIHTTPFHIFKGKGEMRNYWLDFEGSSWN